MVKTKHTCGMCKWPVDWVCVDNSTVEILRAMCLDHAKLGENSLSPTLDSRFFGPSPSQVLYLIEVGLLLFVITADCLIITILGGVRFALC
jgi:hypothetical protein